jgi:hypothetical protein
MSAKEPNDLDSYSLYIDGPDEPHPLTHDLDPDAEWLEQQQDAAYQAAVDAGMFDYPDNANIIADAVSLRDQIKQIHADAVLVMQMSHDTHQVLFSDLDRVLDRRNDAQAEANCAGHFAMKATGR